MLLEPRWVGVILNHKSMLSIVTVGSTLMLVGCNSSTKEVSTEAVDITEFAFIEFDGDNKEGTASHGFDQKKFMLEVFNYNYEEGPADEETVKEMDAVNDAITVSLDKMNGLSNGDTVTLTVDVDESKTDKVKDGEKIFEVNGLEESAN
ncbi:MAG: hypothetical protein ACI33P_04910 [Lysinibacillus sp.]